MTALAAPSHPAPTGARTLIVADVVPLVPGITHFRLTAPDGAVLASYQPGSHVIVRAGERRNAYSLLGDGINPTSYGISVLRRGEGGGSDWLHDRLRPGDRLEVEGPRSMFGPVLAQRHALLVAGGIGVTPILSHARAIARAGGSAEIVYSYRPGQAAHLADLVDLVEPADPAAVTEPSGRSGIRLHQATTVEDTLALLEDRLADQPLGTRAYACGPPGLLESYQRLAAAAGWPEARVRLERFSAPARDPGRPFRVRVASTGARYDVLAGTSLLDTLLAAGLSVPSLCRQGVCGECRIPVRSGDVEHRDLVLSAADRARGDSLLCCVSRGAADSEIEVDL